MKKIAVILLFSIFLLSLAGCSQATGNSGTPPPAVAAPSATPTPTPTPAAAAPTVSPTPSANPGTSDSGYGVIAKSNNAVSGQDKEAVLNELDKELDSLFSNINKMEDVQDSDLSN